MFQLTDGTKTISAMALTIGTGLTLAEDSTGLPTLTGSGGSSSSVDWSTVTNKPTTIAGYGITDALNKTGDSMTGALVANNGFTANTFSLGGQLTALSAPGNEALIFLASGNTSDSQARFRISYSGLLQWGPGGTTNPDVTLYRSSANELTTGSHFVSGGNINASGYIRAQGSYGLALGEVVNVPRIRFGASGATSFDFITGGNANAGVVVGALTAKNSYSATSTTATDLTIGGGGASPNAASITWGDGSGWQLVFGTKVSGAFASRFIFTDGGNFYANGPITSYSTGLFAGALYLGFQLTGAATSGVSSGDLVVQRSASTGYVYFGGNLTKWFGYDGARFVVNDVLNVAGSGGFVLGVASNIQRIIYGSSAATAFSMLTAANGYADLYLSTLVPYAVSMATGGGTLDGGTASWGTIRVQGTKGGYNGIEFYGSTYGKTLIHSTTDDVMGWANTSTGGWALEFAHGQLVGQYAGDATKYMAIWAMSDGYAFGGALNSAGAGGAHQNPYGLLYGYDQGSGGINFTGFSLGWGVGHAENGQVNGWLGQNGWWCRNAVHAYDFVLN